MTTVIRFAVVACLVLTLSVAAQAGTLQVGNPAIDRPNSDGWISNLVIDETATYTNVSGIALDLSIDTFEFYVEVNHNRVTPFVVKVNADNDFTVLAIGDTRVSGVDYDAVDLFSLPFSAAAQTITLGAGETLAAGFLDADPDGTNSGGTRGVISYNDAAGSEIWYSGGSTASDSASVAVGSAPTPGTNTYPSTTNPTLNRIYSFNIQFDLLTTIPGMIEWQTPQTIVSVNDIDLAGSLVRAVNLGAGAVSVTVGSETIPFDTIGTTSDTIEQEGATANGGFYAGTTGDTNFDTVLDSFAYDHNPPGPAELTLNGLTPGQEYQIQLFASDDRSCCSTRTQNFSDALGGPPSDTFAHSESPLTIGTFTAAGASQVVHINDVSTATKHVLNGYVLRAVPEPSSLLLTVFALAALAVVRRRR